MLLICCAVMGRTGSSQLCFMCKGTSHKPVSGHFVPYITISPLYFTMQQSCSKSTLHPALHNFTTESSDCCASFGTIWPEIAVLGMFGQLISHSWVEVILFPSGMTTLIGFCVGCTFMTLAVIAKKLSVVPESSMP